MKLLFTIIVTVLIVDCSSEIPTEYVLKDKALVPEGIAYSEKNDAFYLTSVGLLKIVEVDRKTGIEKDFIKEREYEYSPGAGIYVEEDKNLLHAIGGYYMTDDSLSSVFTFDLTTKKLVKRHDVTDKGGHFLNDMVMDNNGTMYLTDSKDSSIYILRDQDSSLERYYKSAEIEFPNGIAISEDNTKLYIASFSKGVRVMDIASKRILNTADTSGASNGIDGLEYYKKNLFAIQNGIGDNSFNFRKLILNEKQDEIIDIEVIDSHTPRLDVPLTFCIVDDKAVVIANSNLQYLDQVTLEFNAPETVLKTKLITYHIE